jgi:8-oxo-dGTP pyrophosphatase MutT (NUDIX family)
MGRTEHFHDPTAPEANGVVVAATVFVENPDGQVLLIQRSDNGLWAMPGGAMDAGETIAQAAERETLEETGYRVRVTGMIGVYSDPNHVIAYDDGEVRQQFALSFLAVLVGGRLTTSPESVAVRWVSPLDTGALPIHDSIRLRIRHGFEHRPEPYIG